MHAIAQASTAGPDPASSRCDRSTGKVGASARFHRRPPRSPALQHLIRTRLKHGGVRSEVSYGGRHPFELSGRRRTVDGDDDGETETATGGGSQNVSAVAKYEPLRIHFETSQLREGTLGAIDPSSEEFAAAKAKIDTICDVTLPTVSEKWSSLLSVIRATEPLWIHPDACFGLHDVPEAHSEEGVRGADLVVFVSAWDILPNGGQRLCDVGGRTLAAAAPCELDQHDRPYVGLVNFCLGAIEIGGGRGTVTESEVAKLEDVAMHEMAHVLGANSELFKYFRNPTTGEPLTARPFNTTPRYECVDGGVGDVVMPSCSTLRRGKSSTGADFFEVVTPTVAQVVRNQFGCQALSGARLENRPTSSADCFGTHWDERYFLTELMSGIYSSRGGYLSPLTLALLEDSGWYRADFRGAKISPFGHRAGCGFVEGDCIVNGRVPNYSEGFFCDQVRDVAFPFLDAVLCDPTHRSKAKCDLFVGEFPPYDRRYFPQMSVGPRFTHADWCPVATDDMVDCWDADGLGATDLVIPEEQYGSGSHCFVSHIGSMEASLCLSSSCNSVDNVLEILVGDNVFLCDTDFKIISFQSKAGLEVKLQCPRLAAACPNLFCPANCSGKGVCDFSVQPPRCKCFNESDGSPGCFESIPTTPDAQDNCSACSSKQLLLTQWFIISLIFSLFQMD